MFDVAIPLVVGFSFSFLYPSTIIQSSIICLGLPLDLFPSIFPSITVFKSDTPLRVCPLLLSGFYCAYEGSFFSNRFQYFFICLMFCPADFLHSSPSRHFSVVIQNDFSCGNEINVMHNEISLPIDFDSSK